MSKHLLSQKLPAYFVADFASEIQFGIRNIPTSFSRLFSPYGVVIFLYIPNDIDSHRVDIHGAYFGGDNSPPPFAPRKRSNSFNLLDSIKSVDPHSRELLNGAGSSFFIGKLPRAANFECSSSCSTARSRKSRKPGIIRRPEKLNSSRYLSIYNQNLDLVMFNMNFFCM